jgi:hypothetical protein
VTREPSVTVVCATRNARDAVALTLESFRRHTVTPCTVIVADNESTDGTLEYLQAIPWLTVVDLRTRSAALLRAQAAVQRRVEQAATLGERGRRFLEGVVKQQLDQADVMEHGPTLDWLATQVRTSFFLTLDSDVESLEDGWLEDMMRHATERDLVALGPYEEGIAAYRPRLAPSTLLLRTSAFRELRTSFASFVRFSDPADRARWECRPQTQDVDQDELAEFPSGEFFTTGAFLFEQIRRRNLQWEALPERIGSKVRHLGHMSWAGDPRRARSRGLKYEHLTRQQYVDAAQARLRDERG